MNLNRKLLLAITSSIAVLGLTALALVYQLKLQNEKDLLSQYKLNTTEVQEAISAQFYERYGDVQAFASNNTTRYGKKEEIQSLLNDYVKLYGIYNLIILTDVKGNIRAINTVNSAGDKINSSSIYGKNVSKEEWFQNTLEGKFTEDKSKAFLGTYFGDIEKDSMVSEVYGGDQWGTSFTTQVKNDKGEIIGIITTRANLSWITGIVNQTILHLKDEGLKTIKISLVNKKAKTYFNSQIVNGKIENSFLGEGFSSPYYQSNNSRGDLSFFEGDNFITSIRFDDYKFIESIGWTLAIQGSKSEVLNNINTALRNMFFGIIISAIICLILGLYISRKVSQDLMNIASELKKGSDLIEVSGMEVKKSTYELSSSTTQQAAAIEETVSSMEEMGAMLAQTVQQTQQGLIIVEEGMQETANGKVVINKLMSAMDQIDQSNEKLLKLSALIQNIQAKTKIINDIVFETRLLSFNASIEAARASVHGKGFAVVAEEIGKLASMSGKAAEEINALLDSSTKEVNSIVLDIQDKVKTGKVVSENCETAFNVLDITFEKILESVKLIATAAKEQELGIKQTNTAMGEMEQVTQKNSKAAEVLSAQSGPMAEITISLSTSVQSLNHLVNGGHNLNPKVTEVNNLKIKKNIEEAVPAKESRKKLNRASFIQKDS